MYRNMDSGAHGTSGGALEIVYNGNDTPSGAAHDEEEDWAGKFHVEERKDPDPSDLVLGVPSGPVDLDDEIFSLSDDESEDGYDDFVEDGKVPAVLLRQDVHNIPGSPWAKPRARSSTRPNEPLAIAKYASTIALALTLGWVVYLFVVAVWYNSSVGRIVVEFLLAILTFFGLFWNAYFSVSSVFKCFIPKSAFTTNGKYFSVVPEIKHPDDEWLSVTIQVPVYKESLAEVLGPTLQSCKKARDHYIENTGAACNIVVCEDGMMALLGNNFPAAEMLWEKICETKARITNIKVLLKRVPRASRKHLKGLRSKAILEVFARMIYYYRNNIGFVARSTIDRRGKFKKASNLNTHLRLVFGAQQMVEETNKPFLDCLMTVAHNDDGSRDVMFGNNIKIGSLVVINDADARMQPPVIYKTVPEFLNNKQLGFTQHATKTMDDQRGESYFLRMLETYTDALYHGHFLLSSIMGCHPPLVGHSIFLRTEAVRQCGRMRMLRKAQRWLQNIGLPFLGVDQVGFTNLQSENRTEYWSEDHVSEDFELMIHLYNIGYTGRYVAFPDCEFQEGVTRTFDEEAGRHRKFALGAHELMFNPFQDMLGHGLRSPLFRTFLTCDIPSYYKIFLTSYLFSYMSGGIYIFVFVIAAAVKLAGWEEVGTLYTFSPAGVLVLSYVIYYVIGYLTFLIALCRMHSCNRDLLFQEYRSRGKLYLLFKKVRYAMSFQFLFYSVMGNYFFLGGMDHLLSRPKICGATNKDSIRINCCEAIWEVIKFNIGSFGIAMFTGLLAIAVVVQDAGWHYEPFLDGSYIPGWKVLLFSAPPVYLSVMAFIVPFYLNPYVWPCSRFFMRSRAKREEKKKAEEKKARLEAEKTSKYSSGVAKKEQSRNSRKGSSSKSSTNKRSDKRYSQRMSV
eukprot:CAMPEP_0194033988 /NCGR_PEP_ID=MMETSP0009_2-20130614/6432_1 /TAXON_ID=210454 /ORGANISM="Grammatophora oceanica, Strain CCMP 410" /LENGTH=901 /DNA_ID=CAMNT_0038674723 /DNA_START=64 /DNA_END=2769 /DNA_ORIENTATION=+